MQEPTTGNMIPVSEEVAKEADQRGFCVIGLGENVILKGEKFKIYKFDKRGIILEKDKEATDFIVGEKITLKSGNFRIKSIGAKFITINGLPGNKIIDQAYLDYLKKMQIIKTRKEAKKGNKINVTKR